MLARGFLPLQRSSVPHSTAAHTPEQEQRWRRDLMRKGMDVNAKLTELLGKQNATLATMDLPGEGKPGEKPVERLQRFLRQISAAQKRLGTPQWGKCQSCGVVFAHGALDDTPWIEDCGDCQAKRG